MTINDLLKHVPIIVPVRLRSYPHFVIFRGATKRRVLLADPAFGNLTVGLDKFAAAWINYREIGRVGFVVKADGALTPSGALSPQATDFVMLQ